MTQSSLKHTDNWRQEWEDEQQWTPEEIKLHEQEKEENRRILEDMLACIREMEEQEYKEEMNARYYKSYAEYDEYDEYEY